ncbi:MAG TPA: FG-GAP-like repeat-containing protein [Gaiellaceae bacterium]|nr:FG-GAP-like repeat-containing protein [Gaiellaceae bacterium]
MTRSRGLLLCALLGVPLVFGTVAGASGGKAVSFAAPKLLAATPTPAGIAIGDLNGDGKPDLAVANGTVDSEDEDAVGTVSIRLNRGDGTFRPRRDYKAGPGPAAIAIGDLNGDSKPDLAVAGSDGAVSTLFNKGDASFRVEHDYATGDRTTSIAIADLNGDGAADLAATVAEDGTLDVLLNKGDGSFASPVTYAAGQDPWAVAAGDLNGDGAADLAVVSNSESSVVGIFLNDGKGAFGGRRDYAAGPEPVSVAIGDLNGDGTPDLAISHFGSVFRSNTVSALVNDGHARFGSKRDYPVAEGQGPVVIGDVSGDGKPDVVTANDDSNRLSLLVNAGGGHLLPALAYPTGELPQGVALGDLNGDGRLDLVSADSFEDVSNDLTVILSKPGFCDVQNVVKLTLAAARTKLARAGCAAGKVRPSYSKTVSKGLVAAQRPAFGAVLPAGAKVSLLLSRGRRR